ncbi:MAG: prephenate dehydratase [Candidatus Hydrogenedentota bacterium]
MSKSEIEVLRDKINAIDDNIVVLLRKRACLAKSIGEIKLKTGKEFYSPVREHKIYRNLLKKESGDFHKKGLLAVFREIQSVCLNLEKQLRIVYLGPEASFTHIASREKFGDSAFYYPVKTISDVFDEVARESAPYGIVPIENTSEGAVTHTLDMFLEYDLKICAELSIKISHCLLSKAKKLQQIKRIYSNPQALGQCRIYIESHFPGVEVIEVSSTASAAQIASKNKDSAAIASKLAGEVYNIPVIDSEIEDRKNNYTRFLVIGKNFIERSGEDKTSIVFSVKDEVGILYRMLKPFALNGINLTKIESRPSKTKPWEYYFFLDFEGYYKDTKVRRALFELEKNCTFIKILGSYPREVIKE